MSVRYGGIHLPLRRPTHLCLASSNNESNIPPNKKQCIPQKKDPPIPEIVLHLRFPKSYLRSVVRKNNSIARSHQKRKPPEEAHSAAETTPVEVEVKTADETVKKHPEEAHSSEQSTPVDVKLAVETVKKHPEEAHSDAQATPAESVKADMVKSEKQPVPAEVAKPGIFKAFLQWFCWGFIGKIIKKVFVDQYASDIRATVPLFFAFLPGVITRIVEVLSSWEEIGRALKELVMARKGGTGVRDGLCILGLCKVKNQLTTDGADAHI
ncbi:hypothetical protein COLO4_24923 [Corchorus olitorius]|uniref:Uncharacterized protein n=1 Tax=Corchorus olitorius TaxID=93759 RepID=A0A1R3I5U4_9ROSI|nr:hypothetical protein COLO4_24923 [Corchorus olitorius]